MYPNFIFWTNTKKHKTGSPNRVLKAEELFELYEEDERDYAEAKTLWHPKEAAHPKGFKEHDTGVSLWWSGCDYFIEWAQLDTPWKLIQMLLHVGSKNWKGATASRVFMFINTVGQHWQWTFHEVTPFGTRDTSKSAEREKLTPELRYTVLSAGGFQCRACGATPQTGAYLQVDHVVPVSKGGLTDIENLQVLCSCCNKGKGAQ